ncbi:zinc finger CCCH domain-containing 65 isoform X4 [Olea europaea subsp. europaea]|uniref:Zinc finger CCCH domain-containing 65 isoform X4 n=1 Tax=Olea europaea subsp. europaea TaxID=158383 RepID=A0A8S0U9E7_OLEEU|nr:zinc finger CCCH domain-containing 65 isoform X4 [Olea europaea subsp. europaea]
MENSTELETLKSPQNSLFAPPARRRPLRSRTYCSLIQILSHCHNDLQHSQSPQPVPQAQTVGYNGAVECGQVTEHNELTKHEETKCENLLVQQEPVADKSKESIDSQGGGLSGKQKDVPDLVHTNLATEFNGQVAQAYSIVHKDSVIDEAQTSDCSIKSVNGLENVNCIPEQVALANSNIHRDLVLDEAQTSNCAIKSVDELENGNRVSEQLQVVLANNTIHGDSVINKPQTSDCIIRAVDELENVNCVPEFQMEDIGPSREPESNKGVCTVEVFEANNSCFGIDTSSESSKLGENCEGKGSSLDRSTSKEVEDQLRLKEIEFEKLISNSDSIDFSNCVTANEEIEEGEISGEAGVYNDLMDELFEDSMLLEERTTEEGQISGVDKEVFTWDDEDRGFISSALDRMDDDNDNDPMEVDIVRKKQDSLYQTIVYNSAMDTQNIDPTGASLENLSAHGEIFQENNLEKQVSVPGEQVASGDKKKKKKGPLTKERRAKKKKKDRIKRAEKNRKLGVKRLKLQPVLKPKTITYCRHYLKGRCLEGEKCNFSHDTIPLTKSKPCCHFARHSCMKGDDCPFDHQLSKYPCNNYSSQGFCSRSSDCLFSHKLLAESSSPASNVSKPELKSEQQMMLATKGSFTTSNLTKLEAKAPSLLTNSKPDKHLNIHATPPQNADAKFSSTIDSPGKSVEQHVSNPAQGAAAPAPKGVNFLFHAKSLLGDSSKHKQAGLSLKADVGNNVVSDTMFEVSGNIQKPKEISKIAPPRKPAGINFLSFGKVPSDDSNGKKFSRLFSSENNEIETLSLDDSTKAKQACFSQKSCDDVKVDSQTSDSTVDLVQNMKENAKRTSTVAAPWGTNFLAFDKSPLDDSRIKNQAGLRPSDDSILLPFVREKEVTPDRHQILSKMPSNPFGLSIDPSAAECSPSISSSSKTSFLSNTPSSVQKTVQSTLAFAAKFEPEIKLSRSIGSLDVRGSINREAGNS